MTITHLQEVNEGFNGNRGRRHQCREAAPPLHDVSESDDGVPAAVYDSVRRCKKGRA